MKWCCAVVLCRGAVQTASEVELRFVANAALRVVGRLDTAEAQRSEYGFLDGAGRARACILKQGTMIVMQPEVPAPVLLRFPFPAWATKHSEVAVDSADNLIVIGYFFGSINFRYNF